MLGLKVVRRRRHRHCLGLQRQQHFRHHRDAPVGIRLNQRILGRPIIAIVQPVDDPELRIVLDRAIEHLGHKAAHLVADPCSIAASGRDDPQKRLRTLAGGCFHHVVDRAGLVRVQLIYASKVRIQAIERRSLG